MSIEKVESMKYFGCQIDSTLTNRKHIIEKTRQAVSAAAAIYNNKNYEKNKISGLITPKYNNIKYTLEALCILDWNVLKWTKKLTM